MNSSLVKVAPQGDFTEISALIKSWEAQFQMLVGQKQPIKLDVYPMSTIPGELKDVLHQKGYDDLVLAHDRWQHFLVPHSTSKLPEPPTTNAAVQPTR